LHYLGSAERSAEYCVLLIFVDMGLGRSPQSLTD